MSGLCRLLACDFLRAWSVDLGPLILCLRRGVAVLVIILGASAAHAQSASATLSGTITDQTGAVLADVQVVVRNTANGFERHTATDRRGSFTAAFLPPGQYTVSARRQGFTTGEIRDVTLNVNAQLSVDIQLSVQGSTEAVNVLASAEPSRAGVSPSVGTVVGREFIANIPLNGRSLHALLQVVPGVVVTTNGFNGASGGGQFSVNGQRTTSNYITVDGVSGNTGMTASVLGSPYASGSGQTAGTTSLGGTNSLVSMDALQEFRIETSTFAPEFGRTPGGQISLVTRSGSATLHGSASEYVRHDSMDANDWFANRDSQPKPKERQNLFSGVLGGPIAKARLFFFGSYERLRLQQPRTATGSLVTPDIRAQAPEVMRSYLDALPLPNGPVLTPGVARYAYSYSDPGSFDVSALRIDIQPSNALTGFVRVSHAPSATSMRGSSLSRNSTTDVRNDAITGVATWVAGQRVTADVRLNWSRNWPQYYNNLDTFGGAIVPAASDIFLTGRDPSAAAVFFRSSLGSFVWGTGSSDQQRQINTVATIAAAVGDHQIKLGVDYRRTLPLLGGYSGMYENFVLFGAPAQQINQMLSGVIGAYELTNADLQQREVVFSNLSLFSQDTWRVSSRLSLTYGLRLERVPPPTETSGRAARTLYGIDSYALQNPRLAPEGTALWHDRLGEVAPRAGAAYRASSRSGWEATLRGGAGVFYDLGLGDVANAFDQAYPFFADKVTLNVPLPLSGAARVPPVLGLDRPQGLAVMDPNLRLPYTRQWNIAWEQTLNRVQTVTVAYVGAAGRRLLQTQSYRQVVADWPDAPTQIVVQRSIGSSRYNALQCQYQRRLSAGLQVLASYSFAQSRDNASTQTDENTPPVSNRDVFEQEWGASDYDIRHQLSIALTYNIPALTFSGLVQAITQGWGVDLLLRAQSAFPVSPSSGTEFYSGDSGDAYAYSARPDSVPGQPIYISDSTVPGGKRFNAAAFAVPSPGTQGNFPRNGLRGFPMSQIDLCVRREFRVPANVRVQVRAELFNLLNHPNFASPATSIDDPLFGQPSQMLNRSLGGLNALYQVGGPRSGQLAVKVIF